MRLAILVLICWVMLDCLYFQEKLEVLCHADSTGETLLAELQWCLIGECFQQSQSYVIIRLDFALTFFKQLCWAKEETCLG